MIESILKVVTDGVRGILFLLDMGVYWLILVFYKLIVSLANVDLYSNNPAISALLNRIYVIIGIFMLFKLAFAILQYIVDPNAFSDQSKGFTSLIKRVLIALVLLVSIPFIFSKIYEYQGKILNSNVIPNLILGTNENGTDDLEVAAVDLQFMVFGPFFSLNTSTDELKACRPGDDGSYSLSNIIGSTDMALKKGCLEAFTTEMDKDDAVKTSGVTIDKFFKVEGNDKTRNFNSLGSLVTWSLSNGEYAINYVPFISTICGGYLAFLLLSFCIDIAARAIKLMFLQILSPIAIISSIDPTSSSQNDKLKDWGMECLRTYVSLFLRLAVIYVVVQMVKVITSKLFAGIDSLYYEGFRDKADPGLNIWVYIFLIFGAFSVAKKIPELLEKSFGIKMSGEMSMNPLKNFKENLGASILGVGAAAVGAGAVNAGVGLASGSGLRHSVGSAIGGTASTLRRGMTGVAHGERGFSNMRNSFGSAMFARQQREDLLRQGVHGSDILKADVQRHLGIFTDAQSQQLAYDRDEKLLNEIKQERERQERPYKQYAEAMSKVETIINNEDGVKAAQARYDEVLKNGSDVEIKEAKEKLNNAKTKAYKAVKNGIGKYGESNQVVMKSYTDLLDRLRTSYDAIGRYKSYENSEGGFDKASMFSANNDVAVIENTPVEFNGRESYISDLEEELASRKQDPQWAINEKANSASKVNSPQPEGWMPSGEIQGQYRETRGPGGWGDGGLGGPRPPLGGGPGGLG